MHIPAHQASDFVFYTAVFISQLVCFLVHLTFFQESVELKKLEGALKRFADSTTEQEAGGRRCRQAAALSRLNQNASGLYQDELVANLSLLPANDQSASIYRGAPYRTVATGTELLSQSNVRVNPRRRR